MNKAFSKKKKQKKNSKKIQKKQNLCFFLCFYYAGSWKIDWSTTQRKRKKILKKIMFRKCINWFRNSVGLSSCWKIKYQSLTWSKLILVFQKRDTQGTQLCSKSINCRPWHKLFFFLSLSPTMTIMSKLRPAWLSEWHI